MKDLLKASLKSFAADMYSHGLICDITRDTANFEDVMREFVSGMYFKPDEKLEEHCNLFLQSLDKQGGSCIDAASHIAKEWTENIKKKMSINMEFYT